MVTDLVYRDWKEARRPIHKYEAPTRIAKPFAQAVTSASPNIKMRKQQVVRAAYMLLSGPYSHVSASFHVTRSNPIFKQSYDKSLKYFPC
jgi:hypothetical protein